MTEQEARERANRFVGPTDRPSFYGAMNVFSWCVVVCGMMATDPFKSDEARNRVNAHSSADKHGIIFA